MTRDELAKLLEYDPDTGAFRWKVNRRGTAKAGQEAGHINASGYRIIRTHKGRHGAHRLAFLLMTGAMPAGDVDHINGNRADNRWCNLRDVSRAVNMQNLRKPRADNTTGFLGVSLSKGRYQAQIAANGKTHYLGLYDCPKLAHAAYVAHKRLLHSEGNTL